MMDLSFVFMGLSDEQRAKVPTHQLTMLLHWEQTNAAVENWLIFMYWSRIIDPAPDLF